MPYIFTFNGGAGRCSPTINEKFFLFCLMGDKEWYPNQLVRAGHIEKLPGYPEERLGKVDGLPGHNHRYPELMESFMTDSFRYAKMMLQIAGFGVKKQTYVLYFEFVPDNVVCPITTILPLSLDLHTGVRAHPGATEGGDPNYNWLFRGKINMLPTEKVLELWPESTRRYVRTMSPMPLTLKKRLVLTEAEAMNTQVRRIRIRRK